MEDLSNSSIINSSLQPKDIDEDALCEMLGNEECRKIYLCIQESPKIARHIMLATNIPNTTLYRKLTWLLDKGLIGGMIQKHSKKRQSDRVLFYPVIKSIKIDFDSTGVKKTIKLEQTQ